MVLAHVTISPPNFKSVLHSVKHASIPSAQPVFKADALTTATTKTSAPVAVNHQPRPAPPGSDRSSTTSTSSDATVTRPTVLHHRQPTRDSSKSLSASSTSSTSSDRLSRSASPVPWTNAAANNKMHQTSSRLLRMTDEDRPFTRVSECYRESHITFILSAGVKPTINRYITRARVKRCGEPQYHKVMCGCAIGGHQAATVLYVVIVTVRCVVSFHLITRHFTCNVIK